MRWNDWLRLDVWFRYMDHYYTLYEDEMLVKCYDMVPVCVYAVKTVVWKENISTVIESEKLSAPAFESFFLSLQPLFFSLQTFAENER